MSYDGIVVGAGGAALSARERGAEVLAPARAPEAERADNACFTARGLRFAPMAGRASCVVDGNHHCYSEARAG